LTISLIACAAASCLGGRAAQAQDCFWRTTPQDSLLAEQVLESLKCSEVKSVPQLMVVAGNCLYGQPYVAGTLEETPQEELAIYLTRTDCILFVETCLALARTARADGHFPELAEELRQSRYRNGRTSAYSDRLHYTREWASQGIARGTLLDMTEALGGIPYDHPVHYMSTHPQAYPRMDDLEAIRAAETSINAKPFLYIPKEKVGSALDGIRSGDILCLVSGIEGLDILHVGMAAIGGDGKIHLLHASSAAKKVLLDPEPLTDYLAGRKSIVGIQVYRPL
jgi:hypothetical protein